MNKEMRIWRGDDLKAMIGECTEVASERAREAVLEVLHESIGREKLAEWGFFQGTGHLVFALLAREVRLEFIPPPKNRQSIRRPPPPAECHARGVMGATQGSHPCLRPIGKLANRERQIGAAEERLQEGRRQ